MAVKESSKSLQQPSVLQWLIPTKRSGPQRGPRTCYGQPPAVGEGLNGEGANTRYPWALSSQQAMLSAIGDFSGLPKERSRSTVSCMVSCESRQRHEVDKSEAARVRLELSDWTLPRGHVHGPFILYTTSRGSSSPRSHADTVFESTLSFARWKKNAVGKLVGATILTYIDSGYARLKQDQHPRETRLCLPSSSTTVWRKEMTMKDQKLFKTFEEMEGLLWQV